MKQKPTYDEVIAKLAELEEILKAIRNQEVDAIVGTQNILMLRLRETEEVLRKSKELLESQAAQLRATLNATPAIIWIALDCDCRNIMGNQAAHDFLSVEEGTNLSKTGLKPEPLVNYRVFRDGVELEPPDMPIQIVARTGQEIPNCALDFDFANGSSNRSLLGNVIPVMDARGRPTGAIAAFLDVTDRKRAVKELQQAHDELELRVRKRTRDLTYANLQLTKEIAERNRTQRSLEAALSEIKTMKDQLEAENIYLRRANRMEHRFEQILGQSDCLNDVLHRAEQVAPSDTTVLILGETGTGKELIAAAIHNLSSRKERPMITVNCAALPGNLIESELFGREKGAFTGSDTRQVGRFEIANGSTLCLDEIGELPLELQAKLLRVIHHKKFERLGSSKTIKVDVRIVATTNRDLEEEIRKGRFRQDLFYRLNVFPITVPPLRLRKEDIPLMVEVFLQRYARKIGKEINSIKKETMKVLQDYPWPGNVRELESIIERAVILCPGPILQLTDKLHVSSPVFSSTGRTLEEVERNHFLQILNETSWRIEGTNGTAAILGLNPSTLRARMEKLGIVRSEAESLQRHTKRSLQK